MGRVAGNDADAFEVVLERHADAVFSLAYRMCGRRSLAEDVAQEAFLALWRNGARYDRARGSVRTWALGVTHNRAVDTLRRAGVHARRRASEENIDEHLRAPESTDGQAIANVTSHEVRGALGCIAHRAATSDRAGIFRWFHADRDSLDVGGAAGNGQGAHAPGPQKLRRSTSADWKVLGT